MNDSPGLSRGRTGQEPSLGGPAKVDHVVANLITTHPPTRWKAADDLLAMVAGDAAMQQRTADHMLRLCQDANSGIRAVAVYILGRLPTQDEAITRALHDRLTDNAPAIPGLPMGTVADLARQALEG